jgi:cell division septum initiation protein DivIVA
MSVFQPDTETGAHTAKGLPAFQVVRRGYDRQQVDAYLIDLAMRLQEATGRADEAEQARNQAQLELRALKENGAPTFEQLGVEAATVLEQAGRSAAILLEKAQGRADAVVEEARLAADQIRSEADSEAQAALSAAREAAEHVRKEVQEERVVMHTETEQVREFRDGLLDDLGRVHTDIGALLERTRKQRMPPALLPDAALEPAADEDAAPAPEAEEPAEPNAAATKE